MTDQGPTAKPLGEMPLWEYRVVHIETSRSTSPSPADPEQASKKLGGLLSPDFIRREFPEQYGDDLNFHPGKHPAQQLEYFLNMLGRDGWELTNTSQLEHLLMFIFKRPLRFLPQRINPESADQQQEF